MVNARYDQKIRYSVTGFGFCFALNICPAFFLGLVKPFHASPATRHIKIISIRFCIS